MKGQSIDAVFGRTGETDPGFLRKAGGTRLNAPQAFLKDKTPNLRLQPTFEALALDQHIARGVETRELLQGPDGKTFAASLMKDLKRVKFNYRQMFQANSGYDAYSSLGPRVLKEITFVIVVSAIFSILITSAIVISNAIAFWF